MTTGLIFDIQRFSLHDGPGIRTTVFFKGCPLRCLWCHNPESQAMGPEVIVRPGRCIGCGACREACPHGAIGEPARCRACGACAAACYAGAREMVGRPMGVDEVLAVVERDRAFYDQSGGGVTFSGGEPLAQPGFLGELLAGARARGLRTAVDTCGHAPWEVVDRIRPLVDLFLYDVKAVDEARHREFTGVSNALILANLRRLAELGHEVVLRVPLVPGANDDEASIDALGALATSLARRYPVTLLPYHEIGIDKYRRLGKVYRLEGVRAPTAERMAELAARLARLGLQVRIGG